MGVASGMPCDADLLALLPRYAPGAVWQSTLIGRAEIWPVHQKTADLGGMLRTGLEDTFYLPGGERASGNGVLIEALAPARAAPAARWPNAGRGASCNRPACADRPCPARAARWRHRPNHRPLEDGRDDLQFPGAAVWAVLHFDVEHALQQPRPADAARPRQDGVDFALGGGCRPGCRLCLRWWVLRHHQRPQLGIRRQHAAKPDQVQPRPRHQRRQPLHELQRIHDQMGRSIAPRRLELELHLAGGVELDPLVRQRRPRDVAAQLLQPLAVVRLDPHRGVQAETVDVGAQRLARGGLARHRAAERQE
jgi:hypothetical protein